MTPTILDTARTIATGTGRDPLTPMWGASFRAFYGLNLRPEDVALLQASTRRTALGVAGLSGTGKPMREGWFRVGRRGRKSFEAALLGVHEAAFGAHERFLVRGERGLVAVISKDVAGSTAVARFAELHAEALGIKTTWTSMGSVRILELEGIPFGIACFPCSSRAPRGYAMPVVICDEIAHWQTDSDFTNADAEILAAVKPAMAQFPDSRFIAISSPLGCEGIFHETIEANLGDDAAEGVFCAEGPTWLWDPGITRERTEQLEKDPEVHAREYGAVPSQNEGTAFVGADVLACYAPHHGLWRFAQNAMFLDPAGSKNTFAAMIGSWGDPSTERVERRVPVVGIRGLENLVSSTPGDFEPLATRPLFRVRHVFGWSGDEVRAEGMDNVAREIVRLAREHDVKNVFSDEFGAESLAGLIAVVSGGRISMRWFRTGNETKHRSITLIRQLMRDGQISIISHEQMQRDLLSYPRTVSGGSFRYGATRSNQKHHWDFASLFTLLGRTMLEDRAIPEGDSSFTLDGSPLRRAPNFRHVA